MDWKEYQGQIADLFRELGCTVQPEIPTQGARGTHNVDVLVQFTKFGIMQTWIVESKYWKSRVTKEKVVVLQGIVNDVGADRGILVSQSGFQSGAIRASRNTNIFLTSLEDLQSLAKADLHDGMLLSIEQKADVISSEIALSTYITEVTGQDSSYSYPNPEFDNELTGRIFADLAALSLGFKNARYGKFPAITGFEDDHRTPKMANNLEEFVNEASRIVHESHSKWTLEKQRVGI